MDKLLKEDIKYANAKKWYRVSIYTLSILVVFLVTYIVTVSMQTLSLIETRTNKILDCTTIYGKCYEEESTELVDSSRAKLSAASIVCVRDNPGADYPLVYKCILDTIKREVDESSTIYP